MVGWLGHHVQGNEDTQGLCCSSVQQQGTDWLVEVVGENTEWMDVCNLAARSCHAEVRDIESRVVAPGNRSLKVDLAVYKRWLDSILMEHRKMDMAAGPVMLARVVGVVEIGELSIVQMVVDQMTELCRIQSFGV